MEELRRKQETQECGYCKEKKGRMKEILEQLEQEKLRECLKGLEKEKIAKGMMCTKEDEKNLKEQQKMQMLEKRNIERQDHEIDMMWHQMLVEEVQQKEHQERVNESRRQREMIDRRKAYDEQIASANRKRHEAMREEREKENRRLERIKMRMEQDHYETIKKKKDQQSKNKTNYIEGYQMKTARIREDKRRAREIDNESIRVALEELQRERERNRIQMKNLQIEKKIFVDNFNRERRTAVEMEDAADRIAQEWTMAEQNKTDDHVLQMEEEKRANRERKAQEYKNLMNKRSVESQMAKQEHRDRMERVKQAAYDELQCRLEGAQDELKRQIEYRNCLTNQLRENKRYQEIETVVTEVKDWPFTKKPVMFKESLETTLSQKNVTRTSTNPVHPFRRCLTMHSEESGTKLPHI